VRRAGAEDDDERDVGGVGGTASTQLSWPKANMPSFWAEGVKASGYGEGVLSSVDDRRNDEAIEDVAAEGTAAPAGEKSAARTVVAVGVVGGGGSAGGGGGTGASGMRAACP